MTKHKYRVQLIFKQHESEKYYRALVAENYATSKREAVQNAKSYLDLQLTGVKVHATYVAWLDAPWGVADAEKESIRFEE